MFEKKSVFAKFKFLDDILKVIHDLKDLGFTEEEIIVFSPIPSHDIDHVVLKKGLKVARITNIGMVLGISLGIFLVGFTPLLYPIIAPQQGGMPIIVLPPMGILSFETMILLSFIASLAGFIILTRHDRVYKKDKFYDSDLTIDSYAIALHDLTTERLAEVTAVFNESHVLEIR